MAATDKILLLPQFSERQFYRGLPISTLISPKGPVKGKHIISVVKEKKKRSDAKVGKIQVLKCRLFLLPLLLQQKSPQVL